MKKICFLFVCAFIASTFLSACDTKPKPSMVQGKRRLEKYIQPEKQEHNGTTVDLSEGPKLKYDARFGPNTPDFDIKIVNPY